MSVISRSSSLRLCRAVADVEEVAVKRMAPAVRDFIVGGAESEHTSRRNCERFKKYLIRPKISHASLKNVDLTARFTMGGQQFEFTAPFGMAPVSLHGLVHAKMEAPMATVAKTLGVPAIVSMLSNLSYKQIAEVENAENLWFQTYVSKDLDYTLKGLEKVQRAGYRAVAVCVCTPTSGRRRGDERNQFSLPTHLTFGNFPSVSAKRRPGPVELMSRYASRIQEKISVSFDWHDLRRIVSSASVPVVVKGILRGDDAVKAVECGAAAIYVSNHGGRQLDFTPSTIECLPEIAASVAGRVPVFLDGGVRNGSDALKALAFGADLVFVGRPYIYGLSLGVRFHRVLFKQMRDRMGQAGIEYVFRIMQSELWNVMRASGFNSTDQVKESRKTDRVVREEFYHQDFADY